MMGMWDGTGDARPMTDLDRLEELLAKIGGCGDGNCIVYVAPGMHTNGGCRCFRDPIKMQRVIYTYKTELRQLREIVREAETTVYREARSTEMSASIMRDSKRTGGWAGAENTAKAFDRTATRLRTLHNKIKEVMW